VRFAATGGAIPHSPGSFDEFAGMVSSSRHRGRFELHGWLPGGRLEEVYASADAAVYMDLPCAESDLGARTRVLDWIARGIPVLCTRGSDISRTVETEGLGAVVPQGDCAAMAEAVLALAADPDRCQAVRARQEAWSRGAGSCRTAFAPLLDWAARPGRWRTGPLVRGPVPVLDTIPYRLMLLREMVRLEGPSAALGRILGRGRRRG
jgi:glycosyltransferase involved in cell wall biosynthesis